MGAEFGASIKLEDNFTSSVEKAIKGVHGFKSSTEEAKGSSAAFQTSGDKLSGTLKKIAGAAVAAFSISKLKDAFTDVTKAGIEQEQVINRYGTLMRNVKGMTQSNILDVTLMTNKIAEEGVVSENATMAGAGQLATFQLNSKAINTLLPALDDLVVSQKGVNATQEDAVGMANLVGKAMTGNAGALTRYGVTLTETQKALIKNGTEQQRASAVAQALEANYGNLNKTTAQTAAGGMARMKNQMEEMKESLATHLMPSVEKATSMFADALPTIEPVLDSIVTGVSNISEKVLPYLQNGIKVVVSFVESHLPQIQSVASNVFSIIGTVVQTAANVFSTILLPDLQALLDFIKPYMPQIQQAIQKSFGAAQTIIKGLGTAIQATTGFMRQHWSVIAPILAGIAGGVGAYIAITAAMKAWSLITKTQTILQGALNAVMNANPIGIVIVAIGALVAAFIYLWNNCAAFRNFWIGLWKGIQAASAAVANWFGSAWNAVIGAFEAAWNGVGAFFTGLWNGIVGTFKSVMDFFIDGINGIIGGIDTVSGAIGGAIGVNLTVPKIPRFATGTSYFGGGAAVVGEHGPELVTMPKGSAVHSNSDTQKMMGGKPNVTINMNGAVVREEQDIDKIATAIVTKLQKAYDAGMVPA